MPGARGSRTGRRVPPALLSGRRWRVFRGLTAFGLPVEPQSGLADSPGAIQASLDTLAHRRFPDRRSRARGRRAGRGPEAVRVALAKCEAIFRLQEPKKA